MPDLFPSGPVPTHPAQARRGQREYAGRGMESPSGTPRTAPRPSTAAGGPAGPWVRPSAAGAAYTAARAAQRDWRYSTWRGTPKHLDRFCAVNTSGSGPAASTEPRRSSMAWVNPSGTSST
jgi:hypothetical protein